MNKFLLASAFEKFVSGGASSLVFQTIRERYGIGYDVYFGIEYVYENFLIFSLSIPGFEKDKESSLSKAIDELFERILSEDLRDYYEGRRRLFRLLYEKTRTNLYNRLMKEVEYISLLESTYNDVYEESLKYTLEDFRAFLEGLKDGKIVKIEPKADF
jgi:predicted Zn-dependent peptidase